MSLNKVEPSIPILFHLLTIIGTTLSLSVSLWLLLSLTHKKSNYARIMRHIIISECIFIFCQFMIVTVQAIPDIYKLLCTIFLYVTMKVVNIDDPYCNYLKISNKSAYYGNQCFSMLLNIFICLEIILILKNPIAQLKSRLKNYFVASSFIGLIVFFFCFSSSQGVVNSEDYSLTHLYDISIPIYINLAIYILFLILGFISTFYLIVRFCYGKPLLQNLKNFFVLRHFIYVILYIICLLPNKINEFLSIIGKEPTFYLEFSIILNLFMGVLMFIIRVSETKFNFNDSQPGNESTSKVDDRDTNTAFFDKNQPLTAVISKNMNLEFMCCILYGLTEIFMKPERRQKFNSEGTTISDTTVTLNLPNTSNRTLLNQKDRKSISKKDFFRTKAHKIRYKRIFNSNIDFEKLEVEVTSVEKKDILKICRDETIESCNDSEFHSSGDNLKSKKKVEYDAIVVEHCPKIFRELRILDEISGFDLEVALNPMLNKESMEKIRESEGKSGSFFFFSHDNKFIIKTVTCNELNTILGNFLKCYYDHTSFYPESLLTRIYGLYTISIKGVSKINIILMQNLITINKIHIKRIFDLKGSRVERITKNIEKCDKMKTLKDLDFLWMTKTEEDMVDFTKDHVEELLSVLETDLKMLREVGVMDYSLLLIILNFPQQNDPDYEYIFNLFGDKRYCSRIFKSKNKKYIYLVGIIDYLQKFNTAKFWENKYKSIVYGNEIKFVSAVDEVLYSNRMFHFAKENIFISH